MTNDKAFMQRALELAQLGKGKVSPNPLVGCVIVHQNKIIGEGFHQQFGQPHAEVNALHSVENKSLLPFATAYVTLEPCSHHGKTPPCADLLIKHKIKRVVICNQDPFKEVSGAGIKKLQSAGIQVEVGVLQQQGLWVNRRFFMAQNQCRPYLILKWAQTQDGFMDYPKGRNHSPLQISNTENMFLVHQWRAEEDAIWVGMNTVLNDNPSLTTRHVQGKNPVRIVMDIHNTITEKDNFSILNSEAKTFIFNTRINSQRGSTRWIKIRTLDIRTILSYLHSTGIQSIIIEGGQKTLQQFIDQQLWDEARITTSTTLLISAGISSPTIKGELKDQFNCGNDNLVSIFSPIL